MTNDKKDWTREELEKHTVSKMTAVCIPVNIKRKGEERILDLSELERILNNAKRISQTECGCRKKMGNCIEPMDGCIGLDELAIEMIEEHNAKEITVEEALEAMERTHDAGFVHMAYTFTGKDKPEYICSCCYCCCHSLSAALRFGYENHIFGSKYIAVQDEDKCNSCGDCVDRCQFKARSLVDDTLEYERDKCYGCGVCLKTCSEEAISFAER
jgi:NAD-dependent dihydropyrimidine dehydrogenase PreA subunit